MVLDTTRIDIIIKKIAPTNRLINNLEDILSNFMTKFDGKCTSSTFGKIDMLYFTLAKPSIFLYESTTSYLPLHGNGLTSKILLIFCPNSDSKIFSAS